MSSAEAAEFSKLADTTYRDVNIALANEFARYAERVGVDIHEVIAAANSQPYSHIHQPGLGVGGHCIPVYPHFLLSPGAGAGARRRCRAGSTTARSAVAIATLAAGARRPRRACRARARADLPPRRQGAGLLAGAAAHRAAARQGADRLGLRPAAERRRDRRLLCAPPGHWGEPGPCPGDRHPDGRSRLFATLDPAWFPELEVVFDGRTASRALALPDDVAYRGIGVPGRSRRRSSHVLSDTAPARFGTRTVAGH